MLFQLGGAARSKGDLPNAARLFEDALILARETSASISIAEHLTAMILANLASIANELGDGDLALVAAQEARSIWQRRGDRWGLGISNEILAVSALSRAEFNEAAELYWEAQSLYRDFGDRGGIANCLSGIAIVAVNVGRMPVAVRLLAAADAARQSTGKSDSFANQQLHELSIARARAELGERRFEAAWQAGQLLTLEDAIAEATTLSLYQPSEHETPFGLTPRQLEILRLMAVGRTDREIADELFISYRTVTTHVENILKRMGVDSRTAASTDAVRLGLI